MLMRSAEDLCKSCRISRKLYRSCDRLLRPAVSMILCVWYMCAVMASSDAVSDPENARRLGHTSVSVSAAGAVIGIIAIVIIIAVVLSHEACPFRYNGTCYTTKATSGTFWADDECPGETDGYHCYYNSY